MSRDRQYMHQALELARRGRGMTSPNPMVGCLIVRDGVIAGRGYHVECGALHAEAVALADAGGCARDATMYITLEPCCHEGPGKKTPPCVPAVIRAGLKRVVIAMTDPNPLVAGKGAALLRDAGIDVELGVMELEAAELNAPYISLMTRGRPWLTAKWAMSLDGKIATASGDSKWISSEESRKLVHVERAASDAVMAGIGTVLADDPLLTAREEGRRQPLRVIVDPQLKLPPGSRLAMSARESPVLVYTGSATSRRTRTRSPKSNRTATRATQPPHVSTVDRDVAIAPLDGAREALERLGIEIVPFSPGPGGHLAWEAMLADLGKRHIASVLLEGGGGLFTSAFEQKAVDAVMIFIAPILIGGDQAALPLAGHGAARVGDAIRLADVASRQIGHDMLVTGRVTYPPAVACPNIRC